jgi:hypothetical protein
VLTSHLLLMSGCEMFGVVCPLFICACIVTFIVSRVNVLYVQLLSIWMSRPSALIMKVQGSIKTSLHGVTFQKTAFFVVTVSRCSNLSYFTLINDCTDINSENRRMWSAFASSAMLTSSFLFLCQFPIIFSRHVGLYLIWRRFL